MKKQFDVIDTNIRLSEAYKAGYNDFMTGQSFANRYMWAMLPHTFNNWLDGWNDAQQWTDQINEMMVL